MSFLEGFKKVAGKKAKVQFSPAMDQKQFAKYVKKKADHVCETGFAAGKPKDYVWRYDPKHSLEFALAIKSKALWQKWFEAEQAEWVYNHGPDERKDHFDKWSTEPALKPIMLVEGTDGKIHIWDGHHRVAKALSIGMKDVPALIGTRHGK